MNAVVLGGTHDHIELITKLKNLGYFVYLIDYYDNPIAKEFADYHIKGSTLDREFVLQTCIELDAKLCIAFCIDQALLTMAYVSESLGLPCHISFETAQKLTNKVLMKSKFKEHSIPTSPCVYITKDKLCNPKIQDLNYPLVVKPADGNSSKGIQKVMDLDSLEPAIMEAFKFSNMGEVVIEEFIAGIELSVDVIIKDYVPEFVLITENIKREDTPNHFTIIKNLFNKEVHDSYVSKVKEIAQSIARAFNLDNVPLLIQILADGDELHVIEFSSRIGGGSKHHFIKEITKVDVLECFLNILLKKQTRLNPSELITLATMNYVYVYPGVTTELIGQKSLLEGSIIQRFFEYKSSNTTVTESKSSTDRVCGFMVVANSCDELLLKTKIANHTLQVIADTGKDLMMHELF